MGIYVVDVAAEDWADGEVCAPLAAALGEELARRGLGGFTPPARQAARGGDRPVLRSGWSAPFGRLGCPVARPEAPGAAEAFEEKVNRPYDAFEALCRDQADGQQCHDALLDWDVLIPVDFDGVLVLPVSAVLGGDPARVRSAHRAAEAGRRLAAVIGLPDAVPRDGGNLALTNWFSGPAVREAAQRWPGAWREQPDAAYFTALYLGAAEHALRRGCAIAYS
ncbi:hypothetical protein AB0F11_00275 [Streptomyces sp. NPDC032472]|uniref:hypothetical protein n=1 Tax=Streptomyces sp. NPDC032472 TaxID=3155018 RepID=UPI0033C99D7C